MKDLVDPIFSDLGDCDRDQSGQRAQSRARGSRDRVAITFLVVLGLVVLLGSVALLTGLDGRLGRGVAGQVRSGASLEASGEDHWLRLSPGDEVREGARLRTGGTEARLRLRGGEVWLGPEAAARIFSNRVDVIRGEALVSSRGGLFARWADVEVSGKGMFRLTPGTNPRVGVYDGNAEVRRPGERRALAALEQLGIAARRLPSEPDPLAYGAADPWDRELLGEAIAFDDEVSRIARGIDVRFSTAARPPEFYYAFRAVDEMGMPILRAGARQVRSDGRFGPPSDVLVTLFVAEAAGHATEQTVRSAVPQIAQWRAQGSRWGLIALRLGITASDFTRVVDLSQIDRATGSSARTVITDLPLILSPAPHPEEFDSGGLAGDPSASSPPGDSGPTRLLLPPTPPPQQTAGPEDPPDGHERIRVPLDDDRSEARRILDRLLDLLVGVLGSPGVL